MKNLLMIGILSGALFLAGCAHTLKAPCPNYGKYCHQIPVNHWDTNS